jgi:hypothetical protein
MLLTGPSPTLFFLDSCGRSMPNYSSPSDEVDLLLENARLRDALEPFVDESLHVISAAHLTTPEENEFLASMLAWEQAPVLPISQWFEPELVLPAPDKLDNARLHKVLWQTIRKLHEKRIVIEYTDHLSDRQLYCILYRDILPSPEKRLVSPKHCLCWHCIDPDDDVETWLQFYATEDERRLWEEENGLQAPETRRRPFPRQMPR